MSYAIIHIIHGVPLTARVASKINKWEEEEDDRWVDTDGKCGFTTLYSAGGDEPIGYCGVELGTLPHYEASKVSDLPKPSDEDKLRAEALVAALDPELRELAGAIDTYFVWSDS